MPSSWVDKWFLDPARAYAEYSAKATGQAVGFAGSAISGAGSAVTALGQGAGDALKTTAGVVGVAAGAVVMFQLFAIVLLVYVLLRYGGKFVRDFLG